MKTIQSLKYIIAFLISFHTISAESQAPFSNGVNLTGWFQESSAQQIQFTRFTKQDIINIKSLGCDVIRLPVNLHSMTSGSPSYTLDPLYISFQDSVVSWCEQLHIYLIIDNHSFDPNVNTSLGIGDVLVKVWTQMADHYKGRSAYLLYEILNEPHGITTNEWGSIQNKVINAIRTKDSSHTIVVGGSGYNTYTELKNLPVYTDTNLLYTFHFYDPFIFTHQGATWVSPSMEPLTGVPFPYDAIRMPVCPSSLRGTWIESGLNSYWNEGTAVHVKQLIDNALSFRNSRNVNIFCGEFGVYIPNSPDADRTIWYNVMRQYLKENNIPWTIWDYKGGFGLFKKGSDELFEHDLNIPLLQALGFTVPVQTPVSMKPDSTGFMIYTDYVGSGIIGGSYTSGTVNFYSDELPNNNNYCLSWRGFSQYNAIVFDFSPNKDLSKLTAEGYALDFMVRGNAPGMKFDVRFTDTKSQVSGDHPWRISATIDENVVPWDRNWHHLHIPLNSFRETGSYDNNTWYNPAGKFDWTAIDRFEISSEYPATTANRLWFDNIFVTGTDSASVRETGTVGIDNAKQQPVFKLKVNPNPFIYSTKITYNLTGESAAIVSIFSVTGQKVRNLVNESQLPGDHSIIWDGCSEQGVPVPKGLYLCVLATKISKVTAKIIRF
jgi:endoglucanase